MNTKNKDNAFKESTARFSNRLPHWHPMRGQPESNWRRIFGPVIADHMDEASELLGQYRTDLLLSTSTIEAPASLYSAPQDSDSILSSPKNLLLNSDFSEKNGSKHHHWKETDVNEYTQSLNMIIPKESNLVLKYLGTGITSVTVTVLNTVTGLPLILTTSIAGIADTHIGDAVELQNIVVKGSNFDANIILHIGTEDEEWTHSPNDNTYWLDIITPSQYNIKGDDRPVFETNDLQDMFRRTPPTDVSLPLILLPIDIELANKVDFLDLKVEFHGEEYTKDYSVFGGKISKTIDQSVIYDYDLQELDYDGLFRTINDEVLAIHIGVDIIVALVLNVIVSASTSSSSSSSSSSGSSSSGATDKQYSILYLTPDHSMLEDSTMQVIKRFDLGVISELDGKNISLSAHVNDPYSLIIITSTLISTEIYEVSLKYDYYYSDLGANELVFRENYTSITGLSVTELEYSPNFNHLDEHGLMRTLPRIDEELNYDYQTRLIDYSSIHLPGLNQEGVQNGTSIRYGLNILDDIFRIDGSVNILKEKNTIFIYTLDNIITDTTFIDDNYSQIELLNIPAEIRSITVNGKLWPTPLYKSTLNSEIIEFEGYPVIASTDIIVTSYIPYDNIIDITGMSIRQVYLTLQDLGYDLFTETDLNDMASLRAENILDTGGIAPLNFRYYPIRYDPFDLADFAEFQDLSVSFPGFTDLQNKVIEIRNSVHDEWTEQIEGKDRWDMVATNSFGGGLLPGYHDGFFSWLRDEDGLYLHHIAETGGPHFKLGFELDEIQSGVNATLRDLEEVSDLQIESISATYMPEAKPGFLYIKEMQFYMFADKQVETLSDIEYTEIDLAAVRAANPEVDLTGAQSGTYNFSEDTLYVLTADLGVVDVTAYDNILGSNVLIGVAPFALPSIIPVYFLSQEPREGRPVIITDLRASPDEMQYSLTLDGLLTPLNVVADPTQVKVEYDTAAGPELAELPIDIKRDRGFLSVYLSAVISETNITASKLALFNGKGKAKIRGVYDPDIVVSKDIDRDPGEVIILDKNITLTLPAPALANIPNDNLHTEKSGWGHNWGFEFSN